MERSQDRIKRLEKIKEYERQGIFDLDVEDDPPTVPLKAGMVDYTYSKLSTKIASEFANLLAKTFFDNLIRKGDLVIKEVKGMENYLAVKDMGVVITSNHFHPFEQYAVFKAIEKQLGRKRLYKIIREGNYTSFKGLYGFFFRHCNTLPLGSELSVLKELTRGVDTLLKRGEKILIYPEQAMWWNYRKPRPFKSGAFQFAAKSGCPVLPFFLTMEDTERNDGEGFPIEAYTVNILPAIYPDPTLSVKENSQRMCEENYKAWKAVYEDFYKIPLAYETEQA